MECRLHPFWHSQVFPSPLSPFTCLHSAALGPPHSGTPHAHICTSTPAAHVRAPCCCCCRRAVGLCLCRAQTTQAWDPYCPSRRFPATSHLSCAKHCPMPCSPQTRAGEEFACGGRWIMRRPGCWLHVHKLHDACTGLVLQRVHGPVCHCYYRCYYHRVATKGHPTEAPSGGLWGMYCTSNLAGWVRKLDTTCIHNGRNTVVLPGTLPAALCPFLQDQVLHKGNHCV